MTRIKICGLSRPADISAVNTLLPEYIGFVFAPSRRQIDAATAKRLKDNLDPRIKAVGVFVNERPETVAQLARDGIIGLAQLHGDEDADYINRLKSFTDIPVIKAVRVREAGDILEAQRLPCDFLLLDTYIADVRGGGGRTFDWRVIPPCAKPYFLAGGLDPDNVAEAILTCRPYAVDVSSGVETDGVKDEEKIRHFIEAARSVKA